MDASKQFVDAERSDQHVHADDGRPADVGKCAGNVLFLDKLLVADSSKRITRVPAMREERSTRVGA
jgi:hypothetical protein